MIGQAGTGSLRWTLPAALFAALILGAPPAAAVDFLRGDVNSDGVVSVADAYYYINWLDRGGPAPECLLAADVQDDGHWLYQRSAVGRILWQMSNVQASLPKPFPAPGPDPTPNNDPSMACDAYGNGAPLEDPAAELKVLDVVAPGGDQDEVVITLAISSSREIVGYSGLIHFRDGALAGPSDKDIHGDLDPHQGIFRKPEMTDLTGVLDVQVIHHQGYDYELSSGQRFYDVWNDRLAFALLSGSNDPEPEPPPAIPPGVDVPVAQMRICLAEGTRAGTYRMDLESGELVDAETALMIAPRLAGGTLTIESDLAPGKGCERLAPLPCDLEPEELEATYSIGDGIAAPGTPVSLPFRIRANSPFSGIGFSVDFDEEVLEGTAVEPIFRLENGREYAYMNININNGNAAPGNDGIDEGYLNGLIVFTFDVRVELPPAHQDVELARFHFNVRPDAAATSTEVRFLDGSILVHENGEIDGPATNHISLCYDSIAPQTSGSYVFLNGVVKVIDEIALFTRGDVNGDRVVDISDAQAALSYLFLGGERPWCYDAADANDDGDIDIADPVHTLSVLFLAGFDMPPPYPGEGKDPTDDDRLGCLFLR